MIRVSQKTVVLRDTAALPFLLLKTPLKLSCFVVSQLLATGTPAYQVAEKLDITTMTLYRWQKLPEFNSKLNLIANSGLEEIAKKMNAATITAIETLQETMRNLREPSSVRVKAALGVLNSTASVNGVLEKALKHRVADFDLQRRWDIGHSFDMNGNPCEPCCLPYKTNANDDKVITM